jgi:hypothetical protein
MHYSGNTYLSAAQEAKPLDFSPAGTISTYGLFERTDDWSSCAYFYLDSPVNSLPPLDPVEKRVEGLG